MTFGKLLYYFFAAFVLFIIAGCLALIACFIVAKFYEFLEDLFL